MKLKSPRGQWVNSLRHSNAMWHWGSWSILVHIMTACLLAPITAQTNIESLSIGPPGTNLKQKYNDFLSTKCIWKCLLQNIRHFAQPQCVYLISQNNKQHKFCQKSDVFIQNNIPIYSLRCHRHLGWGRKGSRDRKRWTRHASGQRQGLTRTGTHHFNIKTIFIRYRDSHYKDKMVVRPCHFYNGDSKTAKTASLQWNSPLVSTENLSLTNFSAKNRMIIRYGFFSNTVEIIIYMYMES